MPTLKSRIEQLEKKAAPASESRVTLIHFVALGEADTPMTEISFKGKTWHRLPDESEGDFTARVESEVFANGANRGEILMGR
ncbi:MAG TPA: hypothetical protein PK347_17865 [Burkholderiaceae bacterium]|nr:hypothetical protein [Burkholderiaceae bacterium]